MRKTLLRMTATLAMMVGALAGLSLAWSAPASAETFMVETTADSGAGSLRQAVENANATVEDDTIQFGLEAGSTITLASTLTVSSWNLTIEGPGAQSLTISGNNAVRPFRLQTAQLNISGLTIADGSVGTVSDTRANYGGAVHNEGGTLTIRDSVLTNSGAYSAYRGGAISNFFGDVILINSSITGYSAFHGGAIYNEASSHLTLRGSTLSGNEAFGEGGAIYNTLSEVSVTDGSRLEGNAVSGRGGGIYNEGAGSQATITDSTVSGNRASGGWGGGVFTDGDLAVQRSTFSGNFAGRGGGGLLAGSGSRFEMDDSTFHANTSFEEGGGISIRGGSQATITNSTLSGNGSMFYSGGGIWANGTVTIRGSVVAGNTASSGALDVEGNYADGGFNVIGGTAGAAGLQTDADGKPVLADNGGPTQTVALVRGGDAIDAGNSFGSTTDQRGTPRPEDYASADNAQGGDGSDVGAFEYVDPDASAPTVEATPTPLPNEGGLNNSDVTVSIDASDEDGGSGVWRTSYSAGGAQQVPEQNVESDEAELVVSAEGETTVTYWATDNAGNRSESRTLTLRLDKTPPETSISSGPSGPTKKTSASFAFSSPEAGATFECRLTGPSEAHDFRDCASTTGYSALVNGTYTFSVRATDGLGNADATPAMRSWRVDTARPSGEVLINNGRASVTTRTVTLKLEATDPAPASGVVSMRFKNKGSAAWSAWQPYVRSKSWRLTGGAGKKTVYVQYRDAAGNISAAAVDSIVYRP